MSVMDLNLMQGVEGVTRLVATSFVSGLWQGVVLAAGVGICLRLVPRTTAALRFAIWTAVFAVLAVLPLLHAHSLQTGVAMPGHDGVVRVDERWSFAIAAVWLIVSLVRGAKLVVSAVRLRGIWKRAVPVEGCDELLSAAGFRGVELCTSKDVDRPSVIGFFSPRILIPEDIFARLTTAEFGQIVLHEVGHLRRADDWINLLQKLSLVVFPLNPVLMWIERRLCLERELACDDDVLRLTKSPKAYATCLTNLAEHRLGRRAAVLSLGAWEKQSELAQRVHSILRGGDDMGRTQARVVMGVVMLVLVGGAGELSRCPQVVSFSRAALPMAAAVQSAATDGMVYQPVAFRASGNAAGGAHETLLKASMPVSSGVRPVGSAAHAAPAVKKAVSKRSGRPTTPVLQSRVGMRQTRRAEGWVVLTSWQVPVQRRVVFAVDGDHEFVTSFAAVATPSGWLVIQL
jgi:BlaR1 peptidase M56